MSFKDFFQAEILLGSGVEPVYTLGKFDSFPHVLTNFPLGNSRDINCHLIGVSLLLRNFCKPGCGLFKIPKNCGRRDFKLTCIPTLLAAPLPKQHSTPMLIPPSTQAKFTINYSVSQFLLFCRHFSRLFYVTVSWSCWMSEFHPTRGR